MADHKDDTFPDWYEEENKFSSAEDVIEFDDDDLFAQEIGEQVLTFLDNVMVGLAAGDHIKKTCDKVDAHDWHDPEKKAKAILFCFAMAVNSISHPKKSPKSTLLEVIKTLIREDIKEQIKSN